MKNPGKTNNPSEEPMYPIYIAGKIRQHVSGSDEAERNGGPLLDYIDEPFSLEDYLRACDQFLNVEEMLPDALLMDRIKYLMQEGKLKLYYPAGYRCCIAVIPVSPHGMPLAPEEIGNGDFQVSLIVDGKGKTISGFSMAPSYLFKLLPTELQEQCTFEIEPYDLDDLLHVTEADRARVVGAFEQAFRNAQRIFNRPDQ